MMFMFAFSHRDLKPHQEKGCYNKNPKPPNNTYLDIYIINRKYRCKVKSHAPATRVIGCWSALLSTRQLGCIASQQLARTVLKENGLLWQMWKQELPCSFHRQLNHLADVPTITCHFVVANVHQLNHLAGWFHLMKLAHEIGSSARNEETLVFLAASRC